MEISTIRAELRGAGKFSYDEIRHICRIISERELDNTAHAQARPMIRGVIVYWFFSILWLITLLAVLVLNNGLLKLNEGMYWLFVSGSAILMLKNLYGLYRRYKHKNA